MNVRRQFRELAAAIVSEKVMLARAEDRYKAHRREGFMAHNRQGHCEELSRKSMQAGHRERAHREMERARHFGAAAHSAHSRAQYWFAEQRHVANKLHTLEVEEGKVKPKAELDKTQVMFDSVTLSEIPEDAPAVGAYSGGLYHTLPEAERMFPHAHILSIAISAAEHARCLDIENGDATPYQFPTWLHEEIGAKEKPMGYGSVSAWPEIRSLAEAHGHKRTDFLVFTAHYTNEPHICGPHTCGELPWDADLTQWTSAALGRNLDESRLSPVIFA